MEAFFGDFFPPAMLDLYSSMPLGVMKADLWRYAVLYEFGGVYSDIDTVCLEPIEAWLDVATCAGLQLACERDRVHFCQWTIAAAPRHPALARVLELIGERVRADGGVDESKPHYVHYYTGPGVWTDAIRQYLGSGAPPPEIRSTPGLWRDRGIEIHPGDFFDGTKVKHLNASYHWRDSPSGYSSWQYERKDAGKMIMPRPIESTLSLSSWTGSEETTRDRPGTSQGH